MTEFELRVHGVSGTPARNTLYTDPVYRKSKDPYGVRYVSEAPKQGFNPNALALNWGWLTVRSQWTVFWILLAPFALANVAGWMIWKRNRLAALSVRGAGLMLTGLLVTQAISAMTVLYYWMLSRIDELGWPPLNANLGTGLLFGALYLGFAFIVIVPSTWSHMEHRWGRERVGLLLDIRNSALKDSWRGGDPDWKDPALSNIDDPALWQQDDTITHRLRRIHLIFGTGVFVATVSHGANTPWLRNLGVTAACLAVLLLIWTTYRASDRMLINATAKAPIVIVLMVPISLFLLAVGDLPGVGQWPDTHRPSEMVALAFFSFVLLALASGAGKAVGVLFLAGMLGASLGFAVSFVLESLTLTDDPAAAALLRSVSAAENGGNWVAVWMLATVLVLLAVGVVLSWIPIGDDSEDEPPDLDDRDYRAGDGQDWAILEAQIDAEIDAKVARTRALIPARRIVGHAKWLLHSATLVGLTAALIAIDQTCELTTVLECSASRLSAGDTWGPLGWLALGVVGLFSTVMVRMPHTPRTWKVAIPIFTIAIVTLGWRGLLVFTVLKVQVDFRNVAEAAVALTILFPAWFIATNLIIGGFRDQDKARKVGILSDITSFWPRWYHPLSGPSYGPRLINILKEEIAEAVVDAKAPIVLSAHSQGSVMVAVALSQMDEDTVRNSIDRVITYGNPMSFVYRRLFCSVGIDGMIDATCGHPSLNWVNLWRKTDPLGGMPVGGVECGILNAEADGLGHSRYECTTQFSDARAGRPITPPSEYRTC